MNQIWLAFITGLTTGGISCFAVQGGLLLSSTANNKKEDQKKAIVLFLGAKLIAYTTLGILLGVIGSSLIISPNIQGLVQILAGFIMFATVGRLLDLHPVFRKFTLTPPKSVFRLLRTRSSEKGIFSSAVLGFMTVLIPCGITLSMMMLAIASGSALYGGLIMLAFTLGTSPVFFGLGLASNQLFRRKSLKYVAASAITFLGIISISTGLALRGSPHTLQNYWAAVIDTIDTQNETGKVAATTRSGFQNVEIKVMSSGYKSNAQTLRAGVPVNLKLITQNTQGCSRAFTIPEYKISKVLPESGETSLEFTPTKTGRLTYTCSMGMYTGYFEVI